MDWRAAPLVGFVWKKGRLKCGDDSVWRVEVTFGGLFSLLETWFQSLRAARVKCGGEMCFMNINGMIMW